MDILHPKEILEITDVRGWTLLHMAAQNGCRHMMKRLLELGADPDKKTMGTRYWVLESLEYQRLTAEEIARAYDHGKIWDEVNGNNPCSGSSAMS